MIEVFDGTAEEKDRVKQYMPDNPDTETGRRNQLDSSFPRSNQFWLSGTRPRNQLDSSFPRSNRFWTPGTRRWNQLDSSFPRSNQFWTPGPDGGIS